MQFSYSYDALDDVNYLTICMLINCYSYLSFAAVKVRIMLLMI